MNRLHRLGWIALWAALWACLWTVGSTCLAETRSIDDAELERRLRIHHSESARVRLVLLPTAVTDRRGRIVTGLEEDDFTVYEDGTEQEIRFFAAEASEPISIAFVLDVSGSMRQMDKLKHAKEAIRYFVDHLRPGDRFSLICFADDQVDWVTEFTDDRELFLRRLDVQQGFGQTALNDAIAATPRLVDDSISGRKAIVMVTDGIDNASVMSMYRAVSLARQVNVPIFTLGFLSVSADALPRRAVKTNLAVLERVSRETGGRLFAVHGPVELKEAIAYLDAELRFQYLLGYYPQRIPQEGEFRAIRLEVDRRSFMVRTRSGYFANP